MVAMDFPNNPTTNQEFDAFKFDSEAWASSQSGFVDTLPAGSIIEWATNTAPTGWLICDGSAVSRTTYAALFSVIGVTYGVGDGTTTFNVPNFKGRVPVGRDASQSEFTNLAQIGGAKTHTLSTSEMPSHNHGDSGHAHTQNVTANSGGPAVRRDYVSDGSSWTYWQGCETFTSYANITYAGGGQAHNNLQPYQVVNYIIKTTYGTTSDMSQGAQTVAGYASRLTTAETNITTLQANMAKEGDYAAKAGPVSYVAAYRVNWQKGFGSGSSLNWSGYADGIYVNVSGHYEVRGGQRGSENNYSALGISGDRSAIENRVNGVWSHEHNGASGGGGWSESIYIGELYAGELITFGGAANNQSLASAGYAGFLTAKRLK